MTTTAVKTKLVKSLNEWGFGSIAFEVVPLLSSYAWNNSTFADITTSWQVRDLLSSPWTRQEQFDPMVEMVSQKKIKLVGMDEYIQGSDFSIVQQIFDKSQPSIEFDWVKLMSLFYALQQNYFSNTEAPVSQKIEYHEMIDLLRNHAEYLIHQNGLTSDLDAIRQWLRNVDQNYVSMTTEAGQKLKGGDLILSLSNQYRDAQMAENVLWYINNHPDEKIIIWCANFHGAKDISQTEYEQAPGWYNQFRLLGENLYHILGDEVYSLAFTSLTPNFPGEEYGELESAIAESADCPFAFIDFSALRFQEGYRDVSFDCSILGKKKGRWLNIYDGLFYMKDQQRNSLR